MRTIYNSIFKQHDTGMHPENIKRLEVLEPLEDVDLPFDEEIVRLVHTDAYIERVKAICAVEQHLEGDTPTSKGSYEAAVYAVNATVRAAEENAFALVRPPGHHAYRDKASGFCIFNNVAIAAQKLVNEGKKVLIFDFDSHLGDGTSDIFYESDRVMYWSLHQYPAFPNHGWVNEIGSGKGLGYTINVPLPAESGDDIYFDALEYTLPFALAFEPDVVAVSAGFDGYMYDLLLNLKYSVNAFYKTGQMLRKNFHNVFATLEGGYNIEFLPHGIQAFLDGINSVKADFPEKETLSGYKTWAEYEIWVHTLYENLNKIWKL